MRDFERIVLREVAASNFSLITGEVSASGVVEPDRTGPSSRGTHGHASRHLATRDDPARRQHGYRAADSSKGLDDFGDEHERTNLATVSTRLRAGGNEDIDAGLRLRDRMLGRTHERGHRNAFALRPLQHIGRRGSKRIGDEGDGMTQCDVQQVVRALIPDVAPDFRATFESLVGEIRNVDPVAGKDRPRELLVPLRDARRGLGVRLLLTLAFEFRRDEEIHAIGFAIDVLVDPLQLRLERLGGSDIDGAEHAHSAGLGDLHHDIPAMGKGEERKLDSEFSADRRVHDADPRSSIARSMRGRSLLAPAESDQVLVRAARRDIAISRSAFKSGFALGPRPIAGTVITCFGALYDESRALT